MMSIYQIKYQKIVYIIKNLLLPIVLLLLISMEVIQAQTLEYDIIWLGKVGKLYIHIDQKNDSTFIETNSEVKLPFYRLNWITSTSAANGILNSSNYRQLLNDKKREYTEINQRSDSTWIVTDDEGKNEQIGIDNPFYVSKLYLQEPINEKYIFSERFGKALELENKGNGHYRLLLPDENYCEYFYENGVPKIVKAKNGSRTIKMVLSEKT